MKRSKVRNILLAVCLVSVMALGATADAAPSQFIWIGPSDSGGWNGFMQVITQPEYRMQMTNGTPFWSAMLIPMSSGAVSTGMPSVGAPAFGFCPEPGQCYAVLIQRPLAANAPGAAPVCPPSNVPPPSGTAPGNKPNSLW